LAGYAGNPLEIGTLRYNPRHLHVPLPGTKLGPYEILAAIGAGGMGEVYRAQDSRLKRQVAI